MTEGGVVRDIHYVGIAAERVALLERLVSAADCLRSAATALEWAETAEAWLVRMALVEVELVGAAVWAATAAGGGACPTAGT
jgi:hypothetical protein